MLLLTMEHNYNSTSYVFFHLVGSRKALRTRTNKKSSSHKWNSLLCIYTVINWTEDRFKLKLGCSIVEAVDSKTRIEPILLYSFTNTAKYETYWIY